MGRVCGMKWEEEEEEECMQDIGGKARRETSSRKTKT
jgi:hypothetical protein